MIKRELLSMLLVVAATALVSGCITNDYEDTSPNAKLRIKVLVDGSDSLLIQGGKLWIKHHAYQVPGKFNGLEEPVLVNGVEWFPRWIGNTSEAFTGMNVFLPMKAVEVTVECITQRGVVEVFEQPSAENDYTLSVSIDDRAPAGASWYVFDINW